MAQRNPLTITNTTAPLVRQELNDSFEVLQTNFSGPNAPSGAVEGQNWFRTTDKKYFVYRNGNWDEVGSSPNPASEIVAGIAEIATTAEVTAGTDDSKIVSPLKLRQSEGSIVSSSEITAGTETGTRRFSVANIVSLISTHGGSGSGDITDAEFKASLDFLFYDSTAYQFVLGLDGTAGRALISTQNSPKFGATVFVGIIPPTGQSQQELLDTLRPGDGILIELGSKIVIAEIAGVEIAHNAVQVWLLDELYTSGLNSYGEIGTGNGFIKFSRNIHGRFTTELTTAPDKLFGSKNGRWGYKTLADLKFHLLGPDTESLSIGTFAHSQNVPSVAGQYYISTLGQTITLFLTWSTNQQEEIFDNFITGGERFLLGSWEFEVSTTQPITKNTIANGGYTFIGKTVSGNVPNSGNQVLTIKGRVVHWNDAGFYNADREHVYDQAKDIIIGGANVTATDSDSNETVTLSVNDASETQKGVAEISTDTEISTGTDNSKIVSPLGLKNRVGTPATSSEITTGTLTDPRIFSPKQLVDAIGTHGASGGNVTTTTLTNVTSTWTDLTTNNLPNDFYVLSLEATVSSEKVVEAFAIKFSDLTTTSYLDIPINSTNSFRIRRVTTGAKLQIRIDGSDIGTNSVKAYKVPAGQKGEKGDKGDTGDVNANTTIIRTQVTNIGENWSDLISGASDDEFYGISFEGRWSSETGVVMNRYIAFKYSDLTTDGMRVNMRVTVGARFEIRRVDTGNKIQVKRSSNITGTNVITAYRLSIGSVPNASASVRGVLELANNNEAIAGTNTDKAMSPARTRSAIDDRVPSSSETVAGKVQLASNSITNTGTNTTRAVTPAGLRNNVGPQISSSEISSGTETGIRRYSPANLKSFVDAHSAGEVSDSDFANLLRIVFPQETNFTFVSTFGTVAATAKIFVNQTQTFGSTTYLAINTLNNKATAEQLNNDNSVFIEIGSKKLMANVEGVQTETNGKTTRIWLGPILWSSSGTTYSNFGTGTSKIYFHRNFFNDINTVLEHSPASAVVTINNNHFRRWPFDDILTQMIGPDNSGGKGLGTYTYSSSKPTTGDKFYFSGLDVLQLYVTWDGNGEKELLRQYLSKRQKYTLGTYKFQIIGDIDEDGVGYYFNINTITGTPPTSGSHDLTALSKLLFSEDAVGIKSKVYVANKTILSAGSGVTLTNSDANETVTISSSGSYDDVKNMIIAGTNVTKTNNDSAETITLSSDIPDASTSAKGKIQIATATQVVASNLSTTLAMTPSTTKASLDHFIPDASTTQKGRIEIGTNSEVAALASSVLAVSPLALKGVVGAQMSTAERNAGTLAEVRRMTPADIKHIAQNFGTGSWTYVSSHDLSTTGWPSANGANVSIDISSLTSTDQIAFITEYAGTVTASSTTLNPYSNSSIDKKFNVNYLKTTTAYEENVTSLTDEFRSNASLGTPIYNSAFDFNLTSDNTQGVGITFANNKLWVVDGLDNKVYSYSTSGVYDSSASFNLDSNNTDGNGITFANNKFWVVDTTDSKVYAYSSTGTYDSSASFNLDSNNTNSNGITFGNNKFWVVDYTTNKVYAYSATGTYDSSASFNLNSANTNARGITFFNNKFWITDDTDAKVYAYSSTGTYDSSASFNLNSANTNARGITFGKNKLWIVDFSSPDKVYVYEAGTLIRSINAKIDTRGSSDTANTINAYLEANSNISSASLTTSKIHMYKFSLATS